MYPGVRWLLLAKDNFPEKGKDVSHYQPTPPVAAKWMHQFSSSRQGTNCLYNSEKGNKIPGGYISKTKLHNVMKLYSDITNG